MKKINILISDDHTLMRQTLSSILKTDDRFAIFAECSTLEETIQLCQQQQPDIILLGINLQGINGIEATERFTQLFPQAKVLIISGYSQFEYVRRTMRAGAKGYITKKSTIEEIREAILSIQNGNTYICAEIKDRLTSELVYDTKEQTSFKQLTEREIEIIGFIQKGNSSKEISQALHISTRTVEVHRYNILKKLKIKNSLSLVNFIRDNVPVLLNDTYSPLFQTNHSGVS